MSKSDDLVLDKGLPVNLDAERYVLGSLLLDNAHLGKVREHLPVPAVFALEKHRRIYARILEVIDRGETADRITLANELIRHGQLESVDGLSYLISLDDGLPRISNIEGYAKIVGEKYQQRQIIYAAQKTIDRAILGSDSAEALLQGSLADLGVIGAGIHSSNKILNVSGIVEGLEGGVNTLFGGRKFGIPTGFRKLDGYLYGLRPGCVYVIGGATSMGKSALALNIATHVVAQDSPLTYWSLEMSKEDLLMRACCAKAFIPLGRVMKGKLETEDRYALHAALEDLRARPLYINDDGMLTVNDFHSQVEREVRDHGLKVAVLDYLQIMDWASERAQPRFTTEPAGLSHITRTLKVIAKTLGICIVLLSQVTTNRKMRGGKDTRPKLADLRGCGTIENDADVVVLLYREEFDHPDKPELKGTAELIVAKQRGGPIGTVKARFEGKYTRYFEVVEDKEN